MRLGSMAVLALVLCPGAGVALEFTATHTGAHKVMLTDDNVAEQLGEILVGDGIDGILGRRGSDASAGGTIVWRSIRDQNDEQGWRHVFYSQRYVLPDGEVPDGRPDIEEVPLLGAELGLHYDPDGVLAVVFGTQFEDAVAVSSANVSSIDEARATVMSLIGAWPEFDAMDPADQSPEHVEADRARTRGLLVSRGDGVAFDPVWEVPIRDIEGMRWVAILDAHRVELLAVESRQPWSTCAPDTNISAGAIGDPERSDILRSLWATADNSREPGFTHEAHKVAGNFNPDIQVFMGLDYDDDGCGSQTGIQAYELIPVKTIGGSPRYEEYVTEGIRADLGGDALWFTYLTMKTFKERGWSSFDNAGTVGKVVVEAHCKYFYQDIFDNAMFIEDGDPKNFGPEEGVALCPKNSADFHQSAALDILAHEWGHGVIFHSAQWQLSGDGFDYHEGFADVIGYMVEWDQQSSGSGLENAEWKYGEDTSDGFVAVRRVDIDDGIGGYSLHKDDPSTTTHGRGNRLPTAMRLMSVGGTNPVCSRLPTLSGCNVNVSPIGVDAAGRILFKTVNSYLTSTSDWDDFGHIAKNIAFYLYKNCPDDRAEAEQKAVIDAFTAIGYPPSSSMLRNCKVIGPGGGGS